MQIGIAIRHVRVQKGLTQMDLAQKCGLTRTTISQIETGTKHPQAKSLKKICHVLNVPESAIYLYGLEMIDVPESKKELFGHLQPILQDIIDKLILD